MIAPIARIGARYIAGALVAYGMSPADAAALQPEFALIVGSALALVTETVYAVAVKKGWAK